MAELQEVKVCLGRFQPFTLGHIKMATYKDLKGPDKEQQDKLREQPDLKEIAKQKTIILAISTPDDKVDTRHPFNDDVMKDEFDLIKKNYKDEIIDIVVDFPAPLGPRSPNISPSSIEKLKLSTAFKSLKLLEISLISNTTI